MTAMLMTYLTKPSVLSVALVLPLAATGCLFGSVDDDGGYPELRECNGGNSGEDVADNVAISENYGQSLHEMAACGNLAVSVMVALVDGLVQAMISGSNDATPGGWTFDAGTYSTRSDASGQVTDMTIQFFAGQDYGFAAQGELITENVFLISNYLVGASVSVSGSGTATISYDSTGPLVELLGFGATPDNPLVVGLADASTVGSSLGRLEFESTVVVQDSQDPSTITYTTETGRMSANDLLNGGSLGFELIVADGERSDGLDQQLEVEAWTIDYVSAGGGLLGSLGSGDLTGSSEYRVTGGHFDFLGTVTFDNSTMGVTELRCP